MEAITSRRLAARGYDIVIVGAGSAGCVLANRLSEDPAVSVLLVEAGPGWTHPLSAMPRGWVKLTGHPERAWTFPVAPQEGRPEAETWARGRGLGGSSAINGMVWCQGAPQDFDGWARFGAAGWGWPEMARAFAALEDSSGPAHVETDTRPLPEPLFSAVMQAGAGMGLTGREWLAGAGEAAVGCYRHNVTRRGRRSGAARAFLRPALGRPNLTVLTGARVQRVLLAGRRATGVLLRRGGAETEVRAGEVILACGTLHSPQLLQVSGIGPAARLSAAGVPVIADLPGVGAGLAEHLVFALPHRLTGLAGHNPRLRGLGLLREVLRYAATGRGLMSFGASEMGAFVRSSPEAAYPDVQISLSPYTFARGLLSGRLQMEAEPGLTVIGYLLRPHSRGRVGIVSGRIDVPPRIEANWLGDARDAALALAMVRQMRSFAAQPPLARFLGAELSPGPGVGTDAALLAAFRRGFVSGLHATGTCALGEGPLAVVGSDLKVRGVEGLRVIDASVAPAPISSNTNGPVMAIAWRAAERMLGRA